jgi:hypothetical protein
VKKLNKCFEKTENSIFSFWTCPCYQDVCFGCTNVGSGQNDNTQSKISQLEAEIYATLYVTLGD